MLDLKQNITLTGIAKIEGAQVAYLTATISGDGGENASISKSITNKDLYNANKEEVRRDMAEFEEGVYNIEDEIAKNNI